MSDPSPWRMLIDEVRPHLKGRDARGAIGSLRWLEARVVERGGRAGSVRNIIYKNLGSVEEKARLFEILCELYATAGLAPPPPPSGLYPRRLGRDKRTVLRRLEKDPQAQLVVIGGPATGKQVLLDAAERIWPDAMRLNLEGELTGPLLTLAERLGVAKSAESCLARIDPKLAFATVGDLHARLLDILADAVNQAERPLLLRAGEAAQLAGMALFSPEGERTDPSGWARHLLARLKVPYLAALSRGEGHQVLRPPTLKEARRYVMEKLPSLSLEEVESLVRQAGADYGHLGQLIALRALQLGKRARLGPRLERLLAALAILFPPEDPEVPRELLETVLGHPLESLVPTIWALVEAAGEGRLRLLEPVPYRPEPTIAREIHRKALEYFCGGPPYRKLYHGLGAREIDRVLEVLEADPGRLALVPGIWKLAEGWPLPKRRFLARVIVRHWALLGRFDHPERRAALALLMESEAEADRAWARLKEAEHAIDMGHAERAKALAPVPEDLEGPERTEAALVQAALSRWIGDYLEARRWVQLAEREEVPDYLKERVRLWRGVVAKDAGIHDEARTALSKVRGSRLLKARASYQLGDLWMRRGELTAAEAQLKEAAAVLETEGTPAEAAMAWARLGGVARRSGAYAQAEVAFGRARKLAPEGLAWARVRSEEGIFLAAAGRVHEAIHALLESEAVLQRVGDRPKERAYRLLRTRLRLASTLFVRSQGRSFRPPFFPQPAPEALTLLEEVEAALPPLADASERWQALRFDAAVLRALLEGLPPPLLARPVAHPLREAERRLLQATLYLHQGEPEKALAEVYGLSLPEEPGLLAWLNFVEAAARPGSPPGALDIPEPFLASLGEALFLTLGAEPLAAWLEPPSRPDLPEAWGRRLVEAAAKGRAVRTNVYRR